MGIFRRLLQVTRQWRERRAELANPERWLQDIFGGARSKAGINVTADVALEISTIYACVKILSETVAYLPLNLYRRRKGGGRERAWYHPLYPVLHDQANSRQTAYEFRETMQGHLSLRGNSYAEIVRNQAGEIIELYPWHPDLVRPERLGDGSIVYHFQTSAGEKILPAERVLHLPGLAMARDGIMGISPLHYAREMIGLAKATEQYGATFFGNGARPGGILKHPGTLNEKSIDHLKSAWASQFGGDQAHRIAVLEEGMEWTQVGISNNDSQFLETRKFTVEEIARIYRIPLHLLQNLDKASFDNITQQSIEFVMYTMLPWLRRWEQRLMMSLLSEQERGAYFIEFQVAGLLRGDEKTRFDAYATGRQWGWLSINDIRKLENMNPVDGGDNYLQPLNMQPIGGSASPAKKPGANPDKISPAPVSR